MNKIIGLICFLFIIVIIISTLTSCDKNTKPDTTPPDVIITFPLEGATVNEIVVIKVNATDNRAVEFVEIYIDGNAVDTLYTEPYQYSWNTTIYPDSSNHSIIARATDTNDNTSDSELITVTVNNEGFEPPAVTITNYEIFGENISLTWSQSEIPDFSLYGIHRSVNEDEFQLINEITDIEATSYMDSVSQTNNYSYYVSVSDESGLSSNSQIVNVPDSSFFPGPVFLYEPEINGNTIQLIWSKSSIIDFISYSVEKSTNFSDFIIINEVTNFADTTLVDTVTQGEDYDYRIKVTDNAGLSSTSNDVFISSDDFLPASVNLSIESNQENQSLNLEWTENSDSDFSFYKLYRSVNMGVNTSDTLVFETQQQSMTQFIDNNIQEGLEYFYRIYVFDSSNLESVSNEVSGIMKQNPEPVTLEILNVDEDYVDLSWTQSNDILFSHYTIYRSTTPGIDINSQVIYTAYLNTELSFTDSSIVSGNTYYYSIAIFDQVGNYSFGNEEQADVPLITRYFVPSGYTTITEAINAADTGDSVIVENGTYHESLSIDKDIVIGSLFLIDHDETHIDNTVLSGSGVNLVVTLPSHYFSIHFIGLSFEEGNSDGLIKFNDLCNILLNINKCNFYQSLGNGIIGNSSEFSDSTVVSITNCIFDNINNNAISLSGDNIHLYVENSSFNNNQTGVHLSSYHLRNNQITINNCSLSQNSNSAISISGNYLTNNTLIIYNTSFTDNSTNGDGGAIRYSCSSYVSSGNSVYIYNSTFSNNYAEQAGGALLISDNIDDFEIIRCDFFNNTSYNGILSLSGGSDTKSIKNCKIHNNYTSNNPIITGGMLYNCLIYENTVSNGSYLVGSSYMENVVIADNNIIGNTNGTILNSIIWNNGSSLNATGEVMYSNLQDETSGFGNISVDPQFSYDLYHLYSSSPCIDTGNPAPEFNDVDGTRNDMGAYGGPNGDW